MKNTIFVISIVVVIAIFGSIYYYEVMRRNINNNDNQQTNKVVGGTEKNVQQSLLSSDLSGSLDSSGYGYEVKVFINGQDVGIIGGKSESIRLFNKEHSLYKQVKQNNPLLFEQMGVLKEEENTIKVTYKKTSDDPNNPLRVEFRLKDYSEPLFSLVTKKEAGLVERVVTLQKTPPESFVPVKVAE